MNVLGRLSRRAFFAAAPAVGLGAKQAAEHAAASLAGVELSAKQSGYIEVPGSPNPVNDSPSALNYYDRLDPRQILELIQNKDFHSEYESLVYESNKYVYHIDHDLAVHKSFSLSAKIAFQRQRNVARAMKHIDDMRESTWDKAAKMVERHLGINLKEWWRIRNGNRGGNEGAASSGPR